jgi:hypothetical protein
MGGIFGLCCEWTEMEWVMWDLMLLDLLRMLGYVAGVYCNESRKMTCLDMSARQSTYTF